MVAVVGGWAMFSGRQNTIYHGPGRSMLTATLRELAVENATDLIEAPTADVNRKNESLPTFRTAFREEKKRGNYGRTAAMIALKKCR